MSPFTENDFALAKEADLVEVARAIGYTPVKVGHCYSLKEMDSMRIFDHRNWCRFSRVGGSDAGGSQIDFLRAFASMEVKEAVSWLLSFQGYSRERNGMDESTWKEPEIRKNVAVNEPEGPKEVFIPKKAESFKHMFAYLCNSRHISFEMVKAFVKQGLIYEDERYHNVVFLGKDVKGEIKHVSVRGTRDVDGKGYRSDMAGSDKHYGLNVSCNDDKEVHVFEAAIDLMSYCDIHGTMDINAIALGMLSDGPLETYLSEHPGKEIVTFHLDNDEPGRTATEQLMAKYKELGYDVYDEPAPTEYKDINEWLQKGNPTEEIVARQR